MSNRVYAVLIAGSTLWCLAVLAAPVGELPAVYEFFSAICHQDPARSWFIAGEPLPVCIRCASIYFGFLAALVFRLAPDVRWLRASIVLVVAEFVIARTLLDSEIARSFTGLLLGGTAAPFVEQGVREMFRRGDPREPV